MTVFKVGDRVRLVRSDYDNRVDIKNKTGTIISIGLSYTAIEFDERFDKGHNSGSQGKDGYCWNFFSCDNYKLELIGTKSYNIPSLGNVTEPWQREYLAAGMSNIRPKGTPLQQHNPMYCNCGSNDTVKNMASGEVFIYCRACKKERL